mmetsp:Transcript_26441/g.29462  ORF Transcript_26441/g.29462 Transcript_26441/m.29462 type:complete len:828 (+) Transcript_26441:169-2652(+)
MESILHNVVETTAEKKPASPNGIHVPTLSIEAGITMFNAEKYKEALHIFKTIATRGGNNRIIAHFYLGIMYRRGHGVTRDFSAAFRWLCQAAEAGEKRAQNNIGLMYKRAEGVDQDFNKARKWIERSAESSYPPACYNMACLLLKGEGCAKDEDKALYWFRKAAVLGEGVIKERASERARILSKSRGSQRSKSMDVNAAMRYKAQRHKSEPPQNKPKKYIMSKLKEDIDLPPHVINGEEPQQVHERVRSPVQPRVAQEQLLKYPKKNKEELRRKVQLKRQQRHRSPRGQKHKPAQNGKEGKKSSNGKRRAKKSKKETKVKRSHSSGPQSPQLYREDSPMREKRVKFDSNTPAVRRFAYNHEQQQQRDPQLVKVSQMRRNSFNSIENIQLQPQPPTRQPSMPATRASNRTSPLQRPTKPTPIPNLGSPSELRRHTIATSEPPIIPESKILNTQDSLATTTQNESSEILRLRNQINELTQTLDGKYKEISDLKRDNLRQTKQNKRIMEILTLQKQTVTELSRERERVLKHTKRLHKKMTLLKNETKECIVPYSELQIIRALGSGSYGVVSLAKWRSALVAVKQLRARDGQGLQDFIAEASKLSQLRPHPHVVQYIGVTQDPVCLITEYMPKGDLWTRLREKTGLLGRDALSAIKGVASGLLHLHSEGVVHRDIAGRNVLIYEDFHVKLTDFGYARLLRGDQDNFTNQTVGPFRWMAPETMWPITDDGKRRYSRKSDVWMFGCFVYEVFFRRVPYDWIEDVSKIASGVADGTLSLPLPASVPKVANMMRLCLKWEPQERPSFSEITKMIDLIEPGGIPIIPPPDTTKRFS